VYAGSLLLMFALGSCAGGRDQAPPPELGALQAELAEVSVEAEMLRQELAAVRSGGTTEDDLSRTSPPAEGGAGAAPEVPTAETSTTGEDEVPVGTEVAEADPAPPAPEAVEEIAADARTYEVQPGDTLTAIAARMYGDPQKFPLIADANVLDGQLEVGQELVIPADAAE
jgi:nucleoid-associated protein YgaU